MSEGRPLVVVLGASGYLGTAVSLALAARPIRLRLVARRRTRVAARPVAQIEVCALDLTRPGALDTAVAGADAVLHLVAHTAGGWRVTEDDAVAERVNLGLVRDLIEVITAQRRAVPPAILFAGSALTGDDRIDGPEPEHPRSAYVRHKLAAESLLERATAAGLVRGVSLRLPPFYGHGAAESPRLVELMVRRALAGQPLTMWHDGTVRRDLVHIDDVTAAFLAALDHVDALAGTFWPIGSGHAEPVGKILDQIAQIVADHTGEPAVPVISVPPPPGAYPTDFIDVEIDSSAFRRITGWRPRLSLRDGLIRTVTAIAGAAGPTGAAA